ncbi:MAG: cell division protein FtsZ, partial [Clostridia bacterium]|nr:cell division protein FtsZ [Clostridia bacterium]
SAEETKEEIVEAIKGTDLLFIAAGMGGGTGTGAAPVIARLAREMGILTVAFVTKPFSFEGKVRNENANKGIANLKKYVDTLVVIPNDKLLQILPGMFDAFKVADDLLKQGISGIVDLITMPSLINLDFADVNTIMRNQGLAHMGIGIARGENRIIEAVRQAVSSPLLETTIEGARGVILSISGRRSLGIGEVNDAARLVQGIIDDSANIIFGTSLNEDLGEDVKITVIATGFNPVLLDEQKQNDAISSVKRAVNEKPANSVPFAFELRESSLEENDNTVPEHETKPVQQVQRVEQVEVKPVQQEVQTEKKKEIPAFMRKLFGKKD